MHGPEYIVGVIAGPSGPGTFVHLMKLRFLKNTYRVADLRGAYQTLEGLSVGDSLGNVLTFESQAGSYGNGAAMENDGAPFCRTQETQ